MILATGQDRCYDTRGREIPCQGTGQDGQWRFGLSGFPRFKVQGELVEDLLTGLFWPKNAALFEFPMSWEEALRAVARLNRENFLGFSDWRLPNRRELRSLVFYQAKNPVLPPGHPFENLFHGWYWTSTTAVINPRYAWNVHFGGGRMFYSHKEDERMVWPVRGRFRLPATGQHTCYNTLGNPVSCSGTGQDGEIRSGLPWPEPRFELRAEAVFDRLTGLFWTRLADLAPGRVTWEEAFQVVVELNRRKFSGFSDWRLPNINELESLVDAQYHSPALPRDHPFQEVREYYWSSTTSFYDPLWAWALYLAKGAVGIGLKHGPHFYVWAVRGRPWRPREDSNPQPAD
ncbi:DUF1566 domain-containing protein [Thermosulfurimonas marina]|uniref:DUF1566 domain-containing protein n=1 Tax=Thermosulfurimonas marina TaxID=2047767 RepID=A0A6H1WUY3_9BACT|nr:DUF1566 domain-containing protein [Thermosulfurimonas marina]